MPLKNQGRKERRNDHGYTLDAPYRRCERLSHTLRHGWVRLPAGFSARLAPDLRELGDSERPLTGYDKRTLASDVYELIRLLGFNQTGLVGHDWGGLVAYFLAYDHPEVVERLMILDMIPGLARKGEKIDLDFARLIWHVFFHGGMPDLAEFTPSRGGFAPGFSITGPGCKRTSRT